MKIFKNNPSFNTLPNVLSHDWNAFVLSEGIFIMSIKDKSKVCECCKSVFFNVTLRGPKQWEKAKYCSLKCFGKVNGESRKGADETKHWKWKGDKVGYFGVHDWITKHYGQPIGCEVCGLSDPERKYHWANLSGDYKRDRSDFKRMCVSCHRKYDYAKVPKYWAKYHSCCIKCETTKTPHAASGMCDKCYNNRAYKNKTQKV